MSASNPDPAVRDDRAPLLPRRVLSWVAWALALAVLGGSLWLVGRVLGAVANVAIPLAVAMLFVALLHPLDRLLRKILPRGLAAVLTVVIMLAALAAAALLTIMRIAGRWNQLVIDFSQSFSSLAGQIRRLPLPVDFNLINRAESAAQDALHSITQGLAATLLSVTQTTVEFGVGMALCLFAVIFLLYDGAHVWDWARNLRPGRGPQRLADAGEAAWTALTGFVQGTFLIACIHGTVIGGALWLLGVDLALPLGLLVFVGSFVPIIGMLLAGGLAVLITLGTHGAGTHPARGAAGRERARGPRPAALRGRTLRPPAPAGHRGAARPRHLSGRNRRRIARHTRGRGGPRAAWGPLNGRESVVPVGRPSRLSRLARRIRVLTRHHRPPLVRRPGQGLERGQSRSAAHQADQSRLETTESGLDAHRPSGEPDAPATGG